MSEKQQTKTRDPIDRHRGGGLGHPTWSIRSIAYGGVFSALVLLATLVRVPFPVPAGYINLGDGVIFIAAMVLGPFSAVPAALGSVLADWIAGFPVYIPATLLIKGLMGWFAGQMLRKRDGKGVLPYLWIFLVCEILMVAGYFVYEVFVYDPGAAIGSVLYNAFQGIAGVVVGIACVPAVNRFKKHLQSDAQTGL